MPVASAIGSQSDSYSSGDANRVRRQSGAITNDNRSVVSHAETKEILAAFRRKPRAEPKAA
jgi:hypothetical protein